MYSFSQCIFLAWASSRSFCSLEMVLCCSMITSSISSRNDAMLRRNVSSMAERSFSLHRSCCAGREAWVNHGRGGFRLRAVVYHIRVLPPATAIGDYALGREAWVINIGRGGFRLRALVYQNLPPATAIGDCALGLEKTVSSVANSFSTLLKWQ